MSNFVPCKTPRSETVKFRPNVAFILRNPGGQILICERSDWPGTWQFPQGGVKRGETHEEALFREVQEELGLEPSAYKIVDQRGPYQYRFPRNIKKDGYHGQEQTYFLGELLNASARINLECENPEFRDSQWIAPSDFRIAWVSAMKRDVYQQVFRDFFGVEIE